MALLPHGEDVEHTVFPPKLQKSPKNLQLRILINKETDGMESEISVAQLQGDLIRKKVNIKLNLIELFNQNLLVYTMCYF